MNYRTELSFKKANEHSENDDHTLKSLKTFKKWDEDRAQFYAVLTVTGVFVTCSIIGTFVTTECGREKIWFIHR